MKRSRARQLTRETGEIEVRVQRWCARHSDALRRSPPSAGRPS